MLEYELSVEPDENTRVVRLRLTDQDGVHCGSNQVKLADYRTWDWEALFDTRRYVERYAGSLRREGASAPDTAEDLMLELGVFLGTKVLGPEIMQALGQSKQRRSLMVRLPATEGAVLASAFARVPWEIARPGPGETPLMERALVVRVVTASTHERDQPVAAARAAVNAGKAPLRVLLVFAEAPGSRPLAMRLEREQLVELFENEILPRRRVEVDVLCHGVTRTLLQERITASGGYHIVHWSGHGHHNRLEILGEDGAADSLSGEELVALIQDAGGFVPQIFFLSACLSGAFVGIRDWATLQAALRADASARATNTNTAGGAGSTASAGAAKIAQVDEDRRPVDDILADPPGYTGTALALLGCGVPQVVAMRYSVGDSYARELAWWFYKRLLVDDGKHGTDSALALARSDVLQKGSAAAKAMPVDHANPLMFGQSGPLLEPAPGRSKQMSRPRPQPQPLLPGGRRELDRPQMFVGRGRELTRLNQQWPTAADQPWRAAGGPAVALVQGLAGLGKTALAAEAVHLWHRRFDWVLAFQAKPEPLTIEDFLRRVDGKLALASQAYRERYDASPYARVFLEVGQPLRGEERHEQMRVNLIEALRDEKILLVLDNFEANLETVAGDDGYACKDPQWDRLLAALARELPGTRSRLLVTSRHRPAALSDDTECLLLPLGPLPPEEAGLFLRSHAALSALLFADDEARALLERVMRVSRGHPLILERLGTLAHDRTALAGALARLEKKGLKELPDLFAPSQTAAQTMAERAYLEDVAVGSIDLLIERLSLEARRLLWIITLANEPVDESLLGGVWAGRSVEEERLQKTHALIAATEQLPAGLRAQLDALPAEVRRQAEQLDASAVPPVAPLLAELHAAGLISKEAPESPRGAAGASDTAYGFHELVRERIAAWIAVQPDACAGRTAEDVWVAYGQRYAAAFESLYQAGRENSREAAAEAGQRGLVYLVRARAYDVLGSFAGALVTGTREPGLLRGVIAELRAVADQIPAGETRWRVRTYLADALDSAGQPDQALPLYEQAVAEAAGHWSDVAVIQANRASALGDAGHLGAARAARRSSAADHERAGSPRLNVIGSELEALRIDVMQDNARQALPDIEARLGEVRGWWRRHEAGEDVPEAPDPIFLGRALVSGLDIARQAHRFLEQWEACLAVLGEAEKLMRALGESAHERARTRFNQYGPLLRLGRLDEAQHVLEHCLAVFRDVDDLADQQKALSGLADLWAERGDPSQAMALERQALALCNRLPNPQGRAISHHNLANYLDRGGQPGESASHQLASIVYHLVTGHHAELSGSLSNLVVSMRDAARAGTTYDLPRLAELVARPDFDPLARFLAERQVDLAELQAAIDQRVAHVRENIAAQSEETS